MKLVRGWVGGIGELLRHIYLRIRSLHLLGSAHAFGYGVADIASVMHNHNLRTIVAHELAALLRYGIRQDYDRTVSAHRPYQRKADALIAACGFHDD